MRNVVCTICNKTFFNKSTLVRHGQSVHENKKLECLNCKSQFTDSSSLRKHQKHHHFNDGNKKTTFPCEYCESIFSYKSNLKQHELTVHQLLKNYSCIICNERFTTKYKKDRHYRRVHSNNSSVIRRVLLTRDTLSSNNNSQLILGQSRTDIVGKRVITTTCLE